MSVNNWDIVSRKYSSEQVELLKKEYAKLIVKFNGDYESVFTSHEFDVLFKSDMGCKLYVNNNWINDIEIKKYIDFYRAQGLEELLPTKAQIAFRLINSANKARNVRDEALLIRNYCELMGYLDNQTEVKSSATSQNIVLINHESSETTWEEALLKQQTSLMQDTQIILDSQHEQIKH